MLIVIALAAITVLITVIEYIARLRRTLSSAEARVGALEQAARVRRAASVPEGMDACATTSEPPTALVSAWSRHEWYVLLYFSVLISVAKTICSVRCAKRQEEVSVLRVEKVRLLEQNEDLRAASMLVERTAQKLVYVYAIPSIDNIPDPSVQRGRIRGGEESGYVPASLLGSPVRLSPSYLHVRR
jgi:hypothetical protein